MISAAVGAGKSIKSSEPNLPVVLTLSHLAHLAEINPGAAYAYAARKWTIEPYRVFRLKKRPKRNSRAPARGFRTICVPEPELMRLQRWIAQNILSRATPHPRSFAFFPDRGILEAAQHHCNCRWLVKLDIQNFFDSIQEHQCYKVFRSLGYGVLLSFELARICTRGPNRPLQRNQIFPSDGRPYPCNDEGHLPQGAPTSPALANMVVKALDAKLVDIAEARGWVYTRYADDLAFSTQADSSRTEASKLIALAKAEIARFGLELNASKTVVAPPGARRIVLGLLVDGEQPRLTRSFRNNLETHLHALTKGAIGPERHRQARGFASLIGMRRHISGLLAFAHYVEPSYAAACYAKFNSISWPL
nr:reverse transcriptase family protein [Acidocella sp.]